MIFLNIVFCFQFEPFAVDDSDLSVIGKEAPSTCEGLNADQKVIEWIQSFQMPACMTLMKNVNW